MSDDRRHRGAVGRDYAWLLLPWLAFALLLWLNGCATLTRWESQAETRKRQRHAWCAKFLGHQVVRRDIPGTGHVAYYCCAHTGASFDLGDCMLIPEPEDITI